jgi:hypothetical protein
MTITVVTYLANSNDLAAIRSTTVPLLKKHGAVDVRLGFCYAGEHTFQKVVVTTYTDWAAFGMGHAIFDDPEFHEVFKGNSGDVQGRSLLVLEEV